MTVCIGAICEGGKAAVVAADRLLSSVAGLQVEGKRGKILILTPQSLVASTGGTSESELVFDRFRAELESTTSAKTLQIAQRLRDICATMRRDQVEIAFTRHMFNMDFTEYSKLTLTSESNAITKDMFDRIAKFKLNIEILLTGMDGDDARLYWINDETVEAVHELAYRAIGSGVIQATASVSRRGHDPSKSLPETIYALYEAKRAAEMVSGVGRRTDIAVLQAGQKIRFLKRDHIKELGRIYKRMKPRKLSGSDSGQIGSWLS